MPGVGSMITLIMIIWSFASDYGVVVTGLLMLAVLLCFISAIRAQIKRKDPLMRGIAFSCTMAVIALAIHSTVDFNLQIPANAATFMVILALGRSLCISGVRSDAVPGFRFVGGVGYRDEVQRYSPLAPKGYDKAPPTAKSAAPCSEGLPGPIVAWRSSCGRRAFAAINRYLEIIAAGSPSYKGKVLCSEGFLQTAGIATGRRSLQGIDNRRWYPRA